MKTSIISPVLNKLRLFILIFITAISYGQNCDSITPFFQVDLSGNPDSTWVSPTISRDGNCCGTSAPDICVEFEVILHEDALSINFEISSGAVPPGALFYQIDCGPEIPVGEPICLDGAGPHHLTFCKPGNNSNTFSITSFPSPSVGPDITVNTGCEAYIYGNYYDESSITWKSIYPENIGDYDDYLSCLAGCDTTYVNPTTPNPPSFVDFEVCGNDAAGCLTEPICFTTRVHFIPQVSTNIIPDQLNLCYDEQNVNVSTITNFGIEPYSFLWSNGDTDETANLDVGLHYVNVTDSSNCVVVSDSILITQDSLPIIANAGSNQTFCTEIGLGIQLSGAIQMANGGLWTGGNGTYSPTDSNLDATYLPTTAELAQGSTTLILTTTGNHNCPANQDSVTFNFYSFTAIIDQTVTPISCNGLQDGEINVSATGLLGPYSYSLDGSPQDSIGIYSNLNAGIHELQVFNAIGCDSTILIEITQPEAIDLSLLFIDHVGCFGEATGSIQLNTTGGTLPYHYTWHELPGHNSSSASNLIAGSYSIIVSDDNNCQDSIDLNIIQPNEITITLNPTLPLCYQGANGSISSNIAGGVPPYDYNWSNGGQSNVIDSLIAGNYNLTITDNNGCLMNNAVVLNQPPAIDGNISGTSIVCPEEATILGANATGGTGAFQFDWNPSGLTTDTITVYPIQDEFYSVTITDENNCSILLTTSIVVVEMNSFDLQTTISSSEICLGDSTFIGMNYVGEDWETISLSWLHCTPCPTNSPLAEYPSEDTFYVASATNTCGEVIYDTIQIEVNPLPIVTLNESLGEVCLGQSIAFEYLNNSNWSYWWDFGDGNYSSEMNPVHTYNYAFSFPVNLSIIDENGCESSSNSGGIANVFPNAEADFGLSNYDVHMLDPTISFYNYSSNADTYFWDFGDNQISSHFEPMHTYDEHGQYVISLEANNIYNCPDTAYLVISVKPAHAIYVPNAFTPDGDDYNNFFMATGYGIDEQGFTLMVYNRWGEIVFESHDMNVGWNGTYGNDSREVKEGVYIWTIQYKDLTNKQHQMEGHVSVLR